mgnify:CR=1 FL=1
MRNRDEYFFDICWQAGLDPSHPADWVNISQLFSDPDIIESFIESREA